MVSVVEDSLSVDRWPKKKKSQPILSPNETWTLMDIRLKCLILWGKLGRSAWAAFRNLILVMGSMKAPAGTSDERDIKDCHVVLPIIVRLMVFG